MMNADDQAKLEPADEPENDINSELESQSENDEVDAPVEIAPPTEPISAAPPRIVAETPIGGKVRPAPAPRREESRRELPAAEIQPPSEEAPAAEEPAPVSEMEPPKGAQESEPVAELTPPEPESIKEATPEAPAAPAEPPRPARPAVSPKVVATSEVDAAKPEDWDDDISPELAALLFQPKKDKPREEVKEPARAAEKSAAVEQAPAAESAPPAEAIHLTQLEEARTLPITAKGISAPSPRVQPEGKARYERVEEPLEDGQRTHEQWDYRGPDYPILSGRAVKRVVIKEVAYTDGSWRWDFARSYEDGGRESREIRANTDHTCIERIDLIKTQNMVAAEKEVMILAGPLQEEKRGFLSKLLGRGDHEDGPKSWRQASTAEVRHMRQEGGRAFARRKLLGLL